jgi:GNAT superfamily N-acetyltransferase
MTEALIVRRARLADAHRLAALSGVLGYPVASDILVERLTRLLSRPEHVVLLAELAPSPIVGWLHGAEQEFMEAGRRCEILGLVVDSAYRRRGVGRRLMAAVEEWAAARGVEQLTVRSNIARQESHPFYEGLGYARVKTQHVYGKRLGASSEPSPVEVRRAR